MTTLNFRDDVVVKLIDSMGDDGSIAQAARVSTIGENENEYQGLLSRDQGLIGYLMRERHGSPFEHVVMKFYVEAPIFVFREIHRHRMASYNEMSGRYTQLLPEFYVPGDERKLVNIGTSAKPEFGEGSLSQKTIVDWELKRTYVNAWGAYEAMINSGIANEIARLALPVAVYSKMYMTVNLRSAMNFLSLRTQREDARHVSRPQREIEMVAEKVEEIATNLFPVSMGHFNDYGRVAP